MDLILTISLNIIIIGGAFMIILWIIALFILINILLKINYIVKGISKKYKFVVWTLFKPLSILIRFINKVKKNG